jgi:hypothetical protein
MPESHPRGRGPWSRPVVEAPAGTRRSNPAADARGRSPRLHPATSRELPRHDPGQRPPDHATGFITPSDPLETVDVPSSGIHPGPAELSTRGSTRGMDPGDRPGTYPPASGTPDVPAPLGFASRALRGRFASLRTPSGALRCLGLRPPRAPRRAAPLRPLRSSRRRHSQRPGSYACYASLRSAARSVALCAVP